MEHVNYIYDMYINKVNNMNIDKIYWIVWISFTFKFTEKGKKYLCHRRKTSKLE